MTSAGEPYVVTRDLTKRYGQRAAVENLSLTIGRGEIYGFLGPNGAGKTTTLRMLLGLVTPTAGTATIGGRRYAELHDPIRQLGEYKVPVRVAQNIVPQLTVTVEAES